MKKPIAIEATALSFQPHHARPRSAAWSCGSFLTILPLGLIVVEASFQPANAQSTATRSAPLFSLPAPPVTLPFLPSPSGDWTVTIGIGGATTPDYPGSSNSTVSPVPYFSIRRAGSHQRFRSPVDSASIALIDYGNLRAGPAGRLVSSRNASDYSVLNGLSDVDTAFEIGGFAEYYPSDWFRARVEVRQGFGGHNGVVANLSGDFIIPLSNQWTISGGPRFTARSDGATSPYFGVTTSESLASGLPAYEAKGGAHSAGVGAQIRYRYDPQWEVRTYVEYERLLGDAANSPLVALRGSPNQVTFGAGVSYSFDVRVR